MATNLGRRNSLDRDGLMDTFNPNVAPEGEWATFIPRWRGAFHVHKDRKSALRAAHPSFAPSAILYKRQPGFLQPLWVEVERHDVRDEPPKACQLCNKPVNVQSIWDDGLTRDWIRRRGRVLDPPQTAWLCWDCKRHRNR